MIRSTVAHSTARHSRFYFCGCRQLNIHAGMRTMTAPRLTYFLKELEPVVSTMQTSCRQPTALIIPLQRRPLFYLRPGYCLLSDSCPLPPAPSLEDQCLNCCHLQRRLCKPCIYISPPLLAFLERLLSLSGPHVCRPSPHS